ncbi:MAG: hydantoinase/oxoprolinase family protein, partial [bacterium]
RLFEGDAVRAAAGVRQIIDAQMADLIRKVTIERGRDPAEFAILAYGGAGPAHACAYAAEAGIAEVVVPYHATVLSAFGAAAGGVRYTLERSLSVLLPGDAKEAAEPFAALEAEGDRLLEEAGVPAGERRFERWCAMRWRRQIHSIPLPFPGGAVDGAALEEMAAVFAREYVARYGEGSAYTEAGVEITRLWIHALGPSLPPRAAEPPSARRKAAPRERRRVHWGEAGGWAETPIFEGPALGEGSEIEGPAVIEHPGTTIALPPGARALVDGAGHTHIRLPAGGQGEDKREAAP